MLLVIRIVLGVIVIFFAATCIYGLVHMELKEESPSKFLRFCVGAVYIVVLLGLAGIYGYLTKGPNLYKDEIEEARNSGYEDGYSEGRTEGYDEGYGDGYSEAEDSWAEYCEDERSLAYSDGYDDALKEYNITPKE